MPTYSYRCTECGEAFDIQQAFTDDTLTVCPNCGGKLRKLFNNVGVSFTGSGFYRNDSRAPAPSGDAGPSTSGDSSSTTSTSAPKSDAPSSTPAASPAPSTSASPRSPSPSKE